MSTTSRPTRPTRPTQRHDLDRFVSAQDSGGTYLTALREIKSGRKRSHWIWFVFPQLAGLGGKSPSQMSRRYAIASKDEAEAYLAHPVLGKRLREITAALRDSPVREIDQLLGVMAAVDRDKLRSSLTLFKRVAGARVGVREEGDGDGVFGEVLEKYFDGKEDQETVKRL